MTLISKLKALLGLEPRRREERSTAVTVEREPPAESERAVTEPEPSRETVRDRTREPEPEPAREPAAGPTAESEPESEPEPEAEPEPTTAVDEGVAESPPDTDTDADAPVQSISGIGPAYAEQLSSAGVETVGELAAADPAELAEATGLGEARVSSWVEQAAGE